MQELWIAVIERSFRDLMLKDKEDYKDALTFFRHEGDEVGSFNWICLSFDLSRRFWKLRVEDVLHGETREGFF